MDEQDRVVAPVIADCQHRWVSNREHFKVAPADLRNFVAHADDALSPVEQRIGIAPLLGGINVLIAVGPLAGYRQDRLARFRQCRMTFRRPLHWRAGAIALAHLEVIPHAGPVAITTYG